MVTRNRLDRSANETKAIQLVHCTAPCAREYVIPPPTVDERKRGLIRLDGTFMPNGKRVVGIKSKTTLHAINQPHHYLFLDGTYLKDVSVRENLHSIFCLAFIPEDAIVPCCAELKPILSICAACPGLCRINVGFQSHLPNSHVECIQ